MAGRMSGRYRWFQCGALNSGSSNVDSLSPAQGAISLEDLTFTLHSQKGFPGIAAVGVSQHLCGIAKNEARTVNECSRHVLRFHLAFRPPPHELDLIGTQVFASNHSRGAVVLFQTLVDNQTPFLELFRHGSARIGCWVLDVWPINVALRKVQIRLNR